MIIDVGSSAILYIVFRTVVRPSATSSILAENFKLSSVFFLFFFLIVCALCLISVIHVENVSMAEGDDRNVDYISFCWLCLGIFLSIVIFVVSKCYSNIFLTERYQSYSFEREYICFTFSSGLDLRWTVFACMFCLLSTCKLL